MHGTLAHEHATIAACARDHRRHLHRHPEVSLQEAQTARYCADAMRKLGYQVKPSWGHGFTADLSPHTNGPRVALRADMDALAMQELNTHDFVSCQPGVAHMCGHDSHMAIALATARTLAERAASLPCNVRFLFQPCEETPPGGAKGMIEMGCLDGVSEVFGLHNDPGTEVGKVRTRVGALTAAADRFHLTLTGRGCHAAKPQDGLDPIVALAGLVSEWQSIVARRIDPAHIAVLSVTQFHAGTTHNIIPAEAWIEGTVRTFCEHDRSLIEAQMRTSLMSLEARGYTAPFVFQRGYDSIVNHASGVARVAEAARAVVGADHIDTTTPAAAWGEDFSYYLQHVPGAFFLLGSGNRARGITEPLHSPRFDIDEDCLAIGVSVMTELIMRTPAKGR